MNKEQIASLPRGVKKHIREEKARIRREFWDLKTQQEKIKKLYEKFIPKPAEQKIKPTTPKKKKQKTAK